MPTIQRIVKQLVEPTDNNVYIYPVTGIYSTFDENGTPLDQLLDEKIQTPSTPGTNGMVLATDGAGNTMWVPLYNLTMSHRVLTQSGGTYTFANAAEREYATISTTSASVPVTLSISNENEHYLIVVNSGSATTTVGLVGSEGETIIGTGSIDIEPNNFCEIGVIRHTINSVDVYVVTERLLEPYTV